MLIRETTMTEFPSYLAFRYFSFVNLFVLITKTKITRKPSKDAIRKAAVCKTREKKKRMYQLPVDVR